jgi:hypothetical protein
MDTFADAVRGPRGNGTPEVAEPGSLSWARCKIEEVKTKLRGDPGRAYSVEFTAAAEVLREHDPVEFNSLRRLLKNKLVRLGEFDSRKAASPCRALNAGKASAVKWTTIR